MDRNTRLRLDTVHRVYALSREHESTIAGYVDAVRQMGDRLTRAESLVAEQETADRDANVSVATKDEVRRIIEQEHLAHLVRIARAALPEEPELQRRFRMPSRRLNRQAFVGAVRAILAAAASRKALFITDGMPETFVEDLEGLVTRYQEALEQKTLGQARRIGAVAELREVTQELMKLVRRLDGINRKRWQKEPALLAEWLNAKDVNWPHDKPAAPGEPGATKAS
jgi:hypothetical protein